MSQFNLKKGDFTLHARAEDKLSISEDVYNKMTLGNILLLKTA